MSSWCVPSSVTEGSWPSAAMRTAPGKSTSVRSTTSGLNTSSKIGTVERPRGPHTRSVSDSIFSRIYNPPPHHQGRRRNKKNQEGRWRRKHHGIRASHFIKRPSPARFAVFHLFEVVVLFGGVLRRRHLPRQHRGNTEATPRGNTWPAGRQAREAQCAISPRPNGHTMERRNNNHAHSHSFSRAHHAVRVAGAGVHADLARAARDDAAAAGQEAVPHDVLQHARLARRLRPHHRDERQVDRAVLHDHEG